VNRKRTVPLVVILGLSLWLRLSVLDAFVAVDESTWADRSLAFREALLEANWADTYRSVHPGVMTMWVGTLAALGVDGGTWGAEELLFAARPLVAIVTWLSLVGMCWMIWRIWGPKVTLASAILIGFDPFYLAHSRLLGLDAMLTSFMCLSFLSLLVYLGRGGWGYLLWSGACAGLAMLSKSPGAFMVPLGLGLILLYKGQEIRPGLKNLPTLVAPLTLWAAIAGAVFVLCWPGMWVQPWVALRNVVEGMSGYAQMPHEGSNFFMGQPRPDPGVWFYPVALLLRLSPLTVMGVLASSTLWPLLRSNRRRALAALCLYVLSFSVGMTLGAKKFDRYLLPVFPLVDLIGAIGLAAGIRWMRRRRGPVAMLSPPIEAAMGYALVVALMVAQLALILPSRPYYLSYYNPLAGGRPAASRLILVGWGEGLDQAARYLNGLPEAGRLRVISWYSQSLKPFFRGEVAGFGAPLDVGLDYFVLYVNQLQRHPEAMATYCGPQGPEHTIALGGVEYAWVCSSAEVLSDTCPLVDTVRAQRQPGDILVTGDLSPSLAQALAMPAYYVPDDGRDRSSLLGRREGAQRAWYVSPPNERLGAAFRGLAMWGHRLDVTTRDWGEAILFRLPSEFGPAGPIRPVSVRWRTGVSLIGLAILNPALDADQAVGVSLEWRLDHAATSPTGLGLRLIDEEGRVWGTVDEWLLDGAGVPTTDWDSGRGYRTDHLVWPLEGTPPGRYALVGALAESESQRPMEIDASELPAVGTHVRLGEVDVVTASKPLFSGHMMAAEPVYQRLQEGVVLVGVGALPERIRPGDSLPITLLWQAGQELGDPYVLRLQLRDGEGKLLSEWAGPPIPSYPTGEWRAGDLLRGQYELMVPADAPAGACDLSAWLERPGEEPGSPQPPTTTWRAAMELQARARVFEAPPGMQHVEQYRLGEELRLLGYDVGQTRVQAGESVALTLYWQAEQEMDTSWKVFTHLLDEASQIWGQWDSAPVSSTYPTTGWRAGEVVRDDYQIPTRSDAPAGHYRLEVGMYDPLTGDRLEVVDDDGMPQEGDRILLGVLIDIVQEGPLEQDISR
jgi:4-amino-4-deoxy-L-arabinose transferase-like glycosyltransferase